MRTRIASAFMLLLASYITLLLGDIVIALMTKSPPKNGLLGLRGMYSLDEHAGYKLSAGWSGYWDDGVLRSRYQINSLGHRDRELQKDFDPKYRVLLLGDSFTFGNLLPQQKTIDAQLEQLSGNKIDAYNLGLAGAGPPHLLKILSSLPESLKAGSLVYLYYANDLRDDNLRIDNHTIIDGHLVSRYDRASGQWRSEEQLKKGVSGVVSDTKKNSFVDKVFGVLSLVHLRERIQGLGASGPEQSLYPGKKGVNYRASNVERVLEYTKEMAEYAEAHEMKFMILVIPGLPEVSAKEYSIPTQNYLDSLKQNGFAVVELLEKLSPTDFIPHDGHFNEQGAQLVAKEVLSSLDLRF